MASQPSGGQEDLEIYGLCATLDSVNPINQPSGAEARGLFLKGKRWDLGQTVLIRFLDGTNDLRNLVETHAKEWADLTGLTFKFLGPSDNVQSDVRVAFTPALGVGTEEFSSLIGTDARRANQFTPTVKLGFTPRLLPDAKEVKRLILHELGHMLGLIHEHQSPKATFTFNRDALIREFAKLGWTPQMVESNIIARFDPSQVVATEFDPNSIMLYAFDSRFASPPTHTNASISKIDGELIQRIYERPGGPPVPGTGGTTSPITDPGTPLTIGTPSDEEFYIPVNPLLFHFKVAQAGAYVMQTVSEQPWAMSLLGPNSPEKEIDKDEKSNGPGPNALIRATLNPGTYFLRVTARIRDQPGTFRVKVEKA
jgi:hypothetical protein